MALEDIGILLFVDILKMTEYPGSPFTGNIINDLVMFLLVPTIFIIVVIYTLVGRLTPNGKIKLLLSVGIFLFIVFGGYYPMFAYLAGPYFLFLIIFLGLIMFFFGHFGLRRGETQHMPGRALMAATDNSAKASGEALHHLPSRLQGLVVAPSLNMRDRAELERAARGLDREIEDLQKAYDRMVETGAHGTGDVALRLQEKRNQRRMIEAALTGTK